MHVNRHTSDLVPVKVLESLPMPSLKKTGGLPSKVCIFPSCSYCFLIDKMFGPAKLCLQRITVKSD